MSTPPLSDPVLLGIHALAAVLRAVPRGRALVHVVSDAAAVLGEHSSDVPWRQVINDALTQRVVALDATGWHGGSDLDDVPPIFESFEARARALAEGRSR